MYHGDGLRGQLDAEVELLNYRIVPGLDLTEKDFGQGRSVKVDFAGLDALEIDHGDDPTHDHWELNETILVQSGALERHVGCAERHGLVLNLLDPAAGPDGLVIEADAGLLFVRIRPFCIDGIGKGCSGARNIEPGCR